MDAKQIFNRKLFVVLLVTFSYLTTGCDLFFQDPRQILYRPVTIKIENASGQVLPKLPLPVHPPAPSKTENPPPFPETDSLWGKEPAQSGLIEPFSEEEIPYLGGDNCLNSVFFDLIGIPYSKDPAPVYHSKDFHENIQGFVKEPANYFFYKNQLFLKESTYPYLNKNHRLMVGDQVPEEESDQAIDHFYANRLDLYKKTFNGKINSFKISCQYQGQTMGAVKEDLLLNVMESEKSFIFLASKEIHMMTRKKDQALRYISDFMFSKEFFEKNLQFSPN
ncbi:MAG: hypothetical protein ACYDBV_03425 [Nitrospiria bacterium]